MICVTIIYKKGGSELNCLKRVFCLIICCAMLVGVMAANAATAEFTDSAAIVNKTAVKAVTELGLMSAEKDGLFNPEGKLTRAEMCKIICLIDNGGDDPLLDSILVHVPFSDIEDHWAVSYIAYCKNLGAVAGNGDDTFNPDGYITGNQAAKMLLVLIGYNPEISGFVGSDWPINVAVNANKKMLFDNLSINVTKEISRDNLAQMINTALNTTMVEYEMDLYTENDQLMATPRIKEKKGETLLNTRFKGKT